MIMDMDAVIIKAYFMFFWLLLHTGATSTTANTNNETVETCLNYEDCLQQDLFARYNKYIRPVRDPKQAVNLRVTLVINSLIDIKEKDEIMIIVGFIRTFWHDEFLTWDPSKYGGVDHIVIPAERIWLPDIAISNSAARFYDISHKRDFHVEILSDGLVRWSFGGIFKSNCDIKLQDYPFDSQRCDVEIENWMFSTKDVNLDVNKNKTILVSMDPNAVWDYHDAEVQRLIKYENFASVKFTLIWKRKSLYYYVNMVIPIIFMLLVALGVFWLPAECGEKMSLAITIVLAFSVFQIIVMENTPVNSDVVPGITALVLLVTVTATLSLLTSMVVIYISSKSTNTRPPAWLRVLCFKYLAAVLCLQNSAPKCNQALKAQNEANKNNAVPPVIQNGITKTIVSNRTDVEIISNHQTTPGNSQILYQIRHNNGFNYNTEESNTSNEKQGNEDRSCLYRVKQLNSDQQSDNIELKELLDTVKTIKGMFEEKDAEDQVKDEWKYVGRIIDRVAFWMTVTLLIPSLVYIWAT